MTMSNGPGHTIYVNTVWISSSSGATGGGGRTCSTNSHQDQFSNSVSKFDEKMLGGVCEATLPRFEMGVLTRLYNNFRAWHPKTPILRWLAPLMISSSPAYALNGSSDAILWTYHYHRNGFETWKYIQTCMMHNYIFRILCGLIIIGWQAAFGPWAVVSKPLHYDFVLYEVCMHKEGRRVSFIQRASEIRYRRHTIN